MKSCFVVLLLSFTACTAIAQWTGQAWNPRCYYPQIGNRAEIDTIFGDSPNAFIGGAILNIGPRPGKSYGTIASNYPSGNFLSIPAKGMFDGGPDFNLHELHLNKRLNFHLEGEILNIGHFRDSYHNDILTSDLGSDAVIYWEDDLGNYDSLNRSVLAARTPRGDTMTSYGWYPGMAFCAHVTSDTVYDVFCPMGNGGGFDNIFLDSLGIGLIPGGAYLQDRRPTILSQPSRLIHSNFNSDSSHFTRTLWDSRLNGQRGICAIDGKGNIYYIPVGDNFNVADLARQMIYDTLLAASAIPGLIGPEKARHSYAQPFEMHVFPKPPGDSSTDLVYPIELSSNEYWILCFKGSSNFGEHRLVLDSAFVLHSPGYYGSNEFDHIPPVQVRDCGDMTGRGNHMMAVEYKTDPAFTTYCFYELGTQLDDKIDVFYVDGPLHGGIGTIDTITANNDNLQDVIVGEDSRYPTDGGPDNGSIHILYGRRDIPTRAVRRSASTGALLTLYPNPLHGTLEVLAFDPAEAGPVEIKVMDVLGRQVAAFHRELGRGYQSLVLSIPDLPSGEYEVHIFEHSRTAVARLQISK